VKHAKTQFNATIGCFYRFTTNNDSVSRTEATPCCIMLSSGSVFNSNTFLSEQDVQIKTTISHCAGLSLERSCQLSAITRTCGVYHIIIIKAVIQLAIFYFLLKTVNTYYCGVNIPTLDRLTML